MAYEDKDIEFLYDLLQKAVKCQKTPGLTLLEEIASCIDLLAHRLKYEVGAKMEERRTVEFLQKERDNLSSKVNELNNKITELKGQLQVK